MALDDWRWSVVCNRGPQPDRGKGIPTSEKEQGLLNHADEDTKGNSAEATFLVHYSRKKRRFRCAIWQRHLLKKKIRTISTIGSVSIVVPGSVQVTQNRLVRLVGLEYQRCSQCCREQLTPGGTTVFHDLPRPLPEHGGGYMVYYISDLLSLYPREAFHLIMHRFSE